MALRTACQCETLVYSTSRSCITTARSLARPASLWQGRCTFVPWNSHRRYRTAAQQTDREDPTSVTDKPKAADPQAETVEKYGLEAGLWKVFTSKGEAGEDGSQGKGAQAKQLLAKYGSAYLITSISFAVVSFAACYALVNAGVDVSALLGKVGIQVNNTSERVGTVAIAYAAHKALSPVRFPPTVALTPVVARWLGKKADAEKADS